MKTGKLLAASVMAMMLSSCSSYFSVQKMRDNYDEKANSTSLVGKVLKTDKKEADIYKNVKIYLNEDEVGRPFEVIALGAYRPYVIPLIRPERPRIEKYYFLRAAKQCRKLKCDAVIITDKNNYRLIRYKD